MDDLEAEALESAEIETEEYEELQALRGGVDSARVDRPKRTVPAV